MYDEIVDSSWRLRRCFHSGEVRLLSGRAEGRRQHGRSGKGTWLMLSREGLFCILLALAVGGCVSTAKVIENLPPAVQLESGHRFPPFKLGERLTYDAYYGLIRAGTATLVVQDIVEVCGRETYHIVLTARTTRAFSTIFKVDDTVETFIDTEEFIPWKFAKTLEEADYSHDEVSILDQANHVGHYRSTRSGFTKDYELPESCQDTLSIFYFLRFLPFSVGEKFLVKVMSDEKIWEVAFEVKERVRKTIYRGGNYDTFYLVSSAGFDAGALREGRGRVWITADDRKLIVCLKTKLPFGYLTLALVKVDNIYEARGGGGSVRCGQLNGRSDGGDAAKEKSC